MTEPELLPCPFCGMPPYADAGTLGAVVLCSCGTAEVHAKQVRPTLTEAIAAWNCRVRSGEAPRLTRQEIEAVDRALDEVLWTDTKRPDHASLVSARTKLAARAAQDDGGRNNG